MKKIQIFKIKSSSNHTCLARITIDFINSILKKDESYYSRSYLEKCKYVEKKLIRYIKEDLDISYGTSDESYEQ